MASGTPRQALRVGAAIAYIGVLVMFSRLLLGSYLPPLGSAGTWFYTGIGLVVLVVALAEPFYTTPAAALLNSITVLLVAAAFSTNAGAARGASHDTIDAGKLAFAIFGLFVVCSALIAIMLKDAAAPRQRWANAATKVAGALGSARFAFSAIFLASSYAVYSDDSPRLSALFVLWVFVVVIRPFEGVASLVSKLRRTPTSTSGRVTALRDPGLVEIATDQRTSLGAGEVVQFPASGVTARVVDTSQTSTGNWALAAVEDARLPRVGEPIIRTRADAQTPAPVGPVEPGTTLTDIVFRVPGSIDVLREGNLVRVSIRSAEVLYQVVRAVVRSESRTEGGFHRFVEVTARKIGQWDEERREFQRVSWVPLPGSPVILEAVATPTFQPDCVGRVPDSNYGIRVDANLLVTHNTAILGILGIGKTYLAFELIRRTIRAGCKVVAIDITGQYAAEFDDLLPEGEPAKAAGAINEMIASNKMTVSQHVHLGGNINQFKSAVRAHLEQFMGGDQPLLIVDPSAFDVMRQDSKPYSGQASMAPLTLVENTRVFAETLLEIVSDEISHHARVCVVLEEAHSLVPEWNSTAYDGDRQASNAIAKAVLQGRKYGLGFILVTQRTANVTKTILNQCNTVFALRTFDATGIEFLRNYVGDAYTDILSTLEDRTAVVFGRASSCASPVVIRLNDHEDLMEHYAKDAKAAVGDSTAETPPQKSLGSGS